MWFRRLALLPVGFPETLRILASQHVATASPALAIMRPRRLLEIYIADCAEPGVLGRVLRGQTRARHIVLADGPERQRSGTGRVSLWRAYESVSLHDRDEQQLPACTRLDVNVLPMIWNAWFVALAARLVNLERLDLREFEEERWSLLREGAPKLVALRIANRRIFANIAHASDPEFARRLLAGLGRLRVLALPYASARRRDLFVAADRLESLEVLKIDEGAATAPGPPAHATTTTTTDAVREPTMSRLTHLVASSFGAYSAASTLASTPHVRRGVLTFNTRDGAWFLRCLEARLSPWKLGGDSCGGGGDGGGDGDVDGGDATVDRGAEATGLGLTRIAWNCIANGGVEGPVANHLAHFAAQALSKLHTRWSGHDFSESVTAEVRREICTRLPVSPPPPLPPPLPPSIGSDVIV